jgi:hypothetical protein
VYQIFQKIIPVLKGGDISEKNTEKGRRTKNKTAKANLVLLYLNIAYYNLTDTVESILVLQVGVRTPYFLSSIIT